VLSTHSDKTELMVDGCDYRLNLKTSHAVLLITISLTKKVNPFHWKQSDGNAGNDPWIE